MPFTRFELPTTRPVAVDLESGKATPPLSRPAIRGAKRAEPAA